MNSKEVLILYALLIFMRTKWSFMRTQKLLISINQWILFPTKQVWIGFLPLANSFLEPPTNILIYSILLPLPKHCLCYLSSQFLTFPMTNPQPPIFFLFISLERCGETLEYVQFDVLSLWFSKSANLRSQNRQYWWLYLVMLLFSLHGEKEGSAPTRIIRYGCILFRFCNCPIYWDSCKTPCTFATNLLKKRKHETEAMFKKNGSWFFRNHVITFNKYTIFLKSHQIFVVYK